MKQYSKKGRDGKTTLNTPTPISKGDVRLSAMGALEELVAHLQVAALTACELGDVLCRVNAVLSRLWEYIRSGGMARELPTTADLAYLEGELATREADFTPPEGMPSGHNRRAATLWLSATAARRAEREVSAMARIYAVNGMVYAYLNCLSALLTLCAHRADAEGEGRTAMPPAAARPSASVDTEAIVQAVLKRIGGKTMLNLQTAKQLIAKVEAEAAARGQAAVIAVANASGQPIAVHVMDGAYLVSFEVAVKKAYTAAAVKMSTLELSHLVKPGQTFFGLEKLEGLITFGGGIPLFSAGELVGSVGISGGTGEEDHALCEVARAAFEALG